MAIHDTAGTLLTALSLVFAGSSFLVTGLRRQAENTLDADKAIESRKSVYGITALSYAFMLIAAFCLIIPLIPASFVGLISISDEVFVSVGGIALIGSIACPTSAGSLISFQLFLESWGAYESDESDE